MFITSFIKRNVIFLALISFLLSLIFLTYKDYGIPWDEKIFFSTGRYFVVQLFNFLHFPSNLSTQGFVPTPYHVLGHGVFMDMLTVLVGLFFPNFNFETLHLIRALFAIPIFILLYWVVSKLLSRVYGLISIVFLLLFPRFYPEIFYNAVDIPTTLLFTSSLAYFIYYVRTKQTIIKSIIFGLILGVTINQRLLLFYLPILNFVFLFFIVILNPAKPGEGSSERSERKNANARFFTTFRMTSWIEFFFYQFIILISLFIFLHLTHPYLLAHPITGLIDMIKSAKQYPWNAAVLFDGQFFQSGVNPLPWYYLPKTMLITTPLIFILLFLIGNVRIITTLIRPFKSGYKQSAISNYLLVYILALFYLPFILVFLLKPTLYDSWRQFLFLTIPMIIIAMYGLESIIKFTLSRFKLKDQRSKFKTETQSSKRHFSLVRFRLLTMVLSFALSALIFLGLIDTAFTMISLHPYEYLYYNSLVGGLKGAYGKYETDYWGLGYKEAVLWFNKNINQPNKNYKIFVEGDPLSSTSYFKPNMQLITDPLRADYLFTFTRWNFHQRHPGKTIYKVEKEGVPLIFIKEL